MPAATDAYIHENRTRFLEELFEFIRIPSISTLPEHKPDIERAAAFAAGSLKSNCLSCDRKRL